MKEVNAIMLKGDYYFILGGGLGDALFTYMRTPILRKLPLIKKKNPDFQVHAYSQVHNNGVEDLFWYHPVITRHMQVVQLPQFKGYESFDERLINPKFKSCNSLNHDEYEDCEPVFNLSSSEQHRLDQIFSSGEPVTVIQPFAGLSERDVFDTASLETMTSQLPGKKVIIGNNAPRVCCERLQTVGFYSPDVINLIDMAGIRFTYHLVKRCSAFIGCHSSIVLLSWHHKKPTVCILPMPFLNNHWQSLGNHYKEGVGRKNTMIAKFQTHGNRCPEDFDYSSLEFENIKNFLTKYLD